MCRFTWSSYPSATAINISLSEKFDDTVSRSEPRREERGALIDVPYRGFSFKIQVTLGRRRFHPAHWVIEHPRRCFPPENGTKRNRRNTRRADAATPWPSGRSARHSASLWQSQRCGCRVSGLTIGTKIYELFMKFRWSVKQCFQQKWTVRPHLREAVNDDHVILPRKITGDIVALGRECGNSVSLWQSWRWYCRVCELTIGRKIYELFMKFRWGVK